MFKNRIAFLSLIGAIIASTCASVIPINSVQAETGIGADVFRVIITIFGVDESKGDVIAIATAKDEQAKVKLFDASGPDVVPLNASEGGGHLIEYVATFPNLTVNSGEEYKACVATVKDLELICKSGNNSPAARPEFVDLSLNATDIVSQATIEEIDVEAEDEDEGGNEGDEEEENDNNVLPNIPPIG